MRTSLPCSGPDRRAVRPAYGSGASSADPTARTVAADVTVLETSPAAKADSLTDATGSPGARAAPLSAVAPHTAARPASTGRLRDRRLRTSAPTASTAATSTA